MPLPSARQFRATLERHTPSSHQAPLPALRMRDDYLSIFEGLLAARRTWHGTDSDQALRSLSFIYRAAAQWTDPTSALSTSFPRSTRVVARLQAEAEAEIRKILKFRWPDGPRKWSRIRAYLPVMSPALKAMSPAVKHLWPSWEPDVEPAPSAESAVLRQGLNAQALSPFHAREAVSPHMATSADPHSTHVSDWLRRPLSVANEAAGAESQALGLHACFSDYFRDVVIFGTLVNDVDAGLRLLGMRVTQLQGAAREGFECFIGAGLIFDAQSRPFHSGGFTNKEGVAGWAMAVTSLQSRLYVGQYGEGHFHPSSLLGSAPVMMSASLAVNHGRLVGISIKEDHYKPTLSMLRRFLGWLAGLGVDLSQVKIVLPRRFSNFETYAARNILVAPTDDVAAFGEPVSPLPMPAVI